MSVPAWRRAVGVLGSSRVRTAAAVALLAVVVWRLGAGPVVDGLRALDLPAVLAALGIGAATTVCGAARWVLVARRLGMELRLGPAVAHCYRALFLNSVLPAGILGDVGRAVEHGRAVGDVGRGARAVMLEKVAGQIALVVVGTVVLVAEPAVLGTLSLPAQVWGPALGVLAAGALLAARVRRVRTGLGTLLADARRGLLARDAWPGVALLSLAALAGYLGLFLVAARTVGATAPTAQLLPLLVLALFVMGLPVNVGGFGPREAVAAVAFGAVGLGAAQGLSAAVAYGVLTVLSTLPGGLVLLAGILARTRRTIRPAVVPATP
ncbi:lysylphosphatidylglycerol synthase transmembrane domain-containing protein [Pseudonocardia yuanmonensis]|uniref:lysylphosphatidylglycerol synthase transmembrane domain-containing protein n=1 Tax=Pseudonocardia yuanmonensis TaxID=1095914 RepID=UPI0031E86A97